MTNEIRPLSMAEAEEGKVWLMANTGLSFTIVLAHLDLIMPVRWTAEHKYGLVWDSEPALSMSIQTLGELLTVIRLVTYLEGERDHG